jgi:hypothetical protein
MSDGSVRAKTYPQGAFEDLLYEEEMRPEKLWASVQVPTLLLRAGQRILVDNDQLLPEEGAVAIQQGIRDCRYVNFPSLNHYTIVFGVDGESVRVIRDFIEEG